MPIVAAALMDHDVPIARQTATAKDAILYALSVGYGADPSAPGQLAAIYERGLQPVASFANVIAHPGPWMKALGVDWSRLVHAEHRLVLHRDIPIGVPLASRTRMLGIADRGADKGMFASFERVLYDSADDAPIATIIQTNACRGDGGCGSAGSVPDPLPRVPDRAPDGVLDLPIPLSAAALYRLNGDLNPLHIDPSAAAAGGFARPILHGLCTFGYAGNAVTRLLAGDDFAALRALSARFSAAFLPGETLRTETWATGSEIRFRCRSLERDVIVLDSGTARMR
jgi:acyl dehydratase